jgi:MFS family permease
MIAAGRATPPPRPVARPRFDWVGTALLAGGLTALIVGLRPGGTHVALWLAASVVLLVPFGLWERRAADPVVAFPMFRSVHFSAGASLIALLNLVMYALVFQVPLVAAALFDVDARETGRLLVSMMLAMVVMSLVAGRLADRYGARPIALAGTAVALAGVGLLGWVDLTSTWRLAPPLAVVGIGLGLATPAAQSASMSAVRADLAGMAAGIGSTMRYLGGIVGVAVMSLLLDAHGTPGQVVDEHRMLMVVFGGAVLAGLICAALLPGRDDVPVED